MSETTPDSTSSTSITSLQSSSSSKEGSAAPIVIGVTVISALIVVCVIFLVFYFSNRKRQRSSSWQSLQSQTGLPLAPISKLHHVTQESSPPPPPYKDFGRERDNQPGLQPPVPPKDNEESSVRTGASEDAVRVSYPQKTHAGDHHDIV